ncbi:hypothetical protein B6V01_001345 [Methanosarcinales archaeon ex4572_44]|nr:MAG: hypothetical protein B6U67_02075 [Methanosarcinales archaeon ex4484_138]PHP45991.1 MAG: hypothetical protein B6V01_001345 [Methanosarcinales archaeon ex4572_44]RLG26980.1 MAG: hypothetical protein DRN85_01500 [Methanosarcinales archaeon]RLG28570.1 MAG: hypothetical protein DRN70_00280 [Methanosarcinales archaeon]
MSELIYTLSQPFKVKGRRKLGIKEFIFTLTLDLKWFNPTEAKAIVQIGLENELLKREGETLIACFDPTQVNPPIDFKPTAKLLTTGKQTLFEKILDQIIIQTGIEKRELIAAINKNQDTLSKLVEINVSALIVGIEHGADIKDLIETAYQELTDPNPPI